MGSRDNHVDESKHHALEGRTACCQIMACVAFVQAEFWIPKEHDYQVEQGLAISSR